MFHGRSDFLCYDDKDDGVWFCLGNHMQCVVFAFNGAIVEADEDVWCDWYVVFD